MRKMLVVVGVVLGLLVGAPSETAAQTTMADGFGADMGEPTAQWYVSLGLWPSRLVTYRVDALGPDTSILHLSVVDTLVLGAPRRLIVALPSAAQTQTVALMWAQIDSVPEAVVAYTVAGEPYVYLARQSGQTWGPPGLWFTRVTVMGQILVPVQP